MTVQAAKCSPDSSYKLGAWIRDSMAGIGTMTFYDPEAGVFGALGPRHQRRGYGTADAVILRLHYAEVSDVKKGTCGAPAGSTVPSRSAGIWAISTPTPKSGIFGQLTDDSLAAGAKPVEVAQRSDVKTGKATILSNIAGDKVEEYEVETPASILRTTTIPAT